MNEDENAATVEVLVKFASKMTMTVAMALMLARGNPDRAITRLEAASESWEHMPFDGNKVMIEAVREARAKIEEAARSGGG